MSKLTAFIDLTRAHFIPAWMIIFLAGFATATAYYSGFSWELAIKVALIGVLGFEGGMVLNDWVDRELDKKEHEQGLTRYFRLFKTRPLVSGSLSPNQALIVVTILAGLALTLILNLPAPHSYYVLAIMIYAYLVEYFYQIKKRDQQFPWAQLLGRTDFALFPVAGYLTVGQPDPIALWYFLFFFALAQAHLAINDLADWPNDKAKQLASIPNLYGKQGTVVWIIGFLSLHLFLSLLFVLQFQVSAVAGFLISYIFLGVSAYRILKNPVPTIGLKVLPFIHVAMALQSLSLIAAAWL